MFYSLFTFAGLRAQNLIPNPGFETYTACPSSGGMILNAAPWVLPPQMSGTPDFFHTCATTITVSVPSNLFGYAFPHSGNGYAGLMFSHQYNLPEHISTPLLAPLVAGNVYHVSFWVQRGETYPCATDGLQARFWVGQPVFPVGTGNLFSYAPHIANTSGNIITDTSSWVQVSGYYTAAGGENWLVIGNFNSAAAISFIGGSSSFNNSYYFIDDVSVINPGLTIIGSHEGCPGDTAVLTAVNGSNYWWEDLNFPGDTLDTGSVLTTVPLVSTSYVVHASSGTDTIAITVFQPPVVSLGNDTTICGSSWLLDAGNPGMSYLWSTGLTTQQQLITSPGSGTYWVQVTDSIGCSSTDTINITLINPTPFSLGPDTTLCDDSLYLQVNVPGVQYLWSTGATTSSVYASQTGLYWAETNNQGCTYRDSVLVTIQYPPAVDLGNDTSFCTGTLLLQAGNTGNSTLWSDSSTGNSLHVQNSGLYWATVTQGVCSVTDSIYVNIGPVPVLNLGPDRQVCDDPVTLTAGTHHSIIWSTGDTTPSIQVNQSGTYSVQVSNGLCDASDTIMIDFSTTPVIDLGPDRVRCTGDSVLLNAWAPAATWEWHDGSTNAIHYATASGVYAVSVSRDHCTFHDEVTVHTAEAPDLKPAYSLCDGIVRLNADVPGTILWSTGETTSQVEISEPGNVWITVNYGDCLMHDSTAITGNLSGDAVFLPNAFRPNSDGRNDVFPGTLSPVESLSFSVYNRIGERIFHTNSSAENWDGTYLGQPCPVGVYVYVLEYFSSCSNEKQYRSGHFTLVR